MTDPTEDLCKANAMMTKLNEALRECGKENHVHIEILCTAIRAQLGKVRSWAMNHEDR